jgi:hypothetical protein
MNIDLRNVSDRFEKNVNQVKRLKDFKTNTTAVEHCVNSYLPLMDANKELLEKLEECRRERDKYKSKILDFKEVFENLME